MATISVVTNAGLARPGHDVVNRCRPEFRSGRGFSSSRGFTLVEVLVAALIMAVGLLGVSAMQMRSMQYNQQAYLYSQATILVNDIAEKMRSNPEMAESYEIEFFDKGDTGVASNKCITAACTPEDFAKWDIRLWKDTLAATLPGGDGEVQPSGGVDEYSVTARFIANRGEADDEDFDKDTDAFATVTINVSL